MPHLPHARPSTTSRQFGVFLITGQVRRHASEIGARSEWVQLFVSMSSLYPPLSGTRAILPVRLPKTWWCMGVHLGAPPPRWLARGQATSTLLRLNRHRSTNFVELLVLTRYLYHPNRTLGH